MDHVLTVGVTQIRTNILSVNWKIRLRIHGYGSYGYRYTGMDNRGIELIKIKIQVRYMFLHTNSKGANIKLCVLYRVCHHFKLYLLYLLFLLNHI